MKAQTVWRVVCDLCEFVSEATTDGHDGSLEIVRNGSQKIFSNFVELRKLPRHIIEGVAEFPQLIFGADLNPVGELPCAQAMDRHLQVLDRAVQAVGQEQSPRQPQKGKKPGRHQKPLQAL